MASVGMGPRKKKVREPRLLLVNILERRSRNAWQAFFRRRSRVFAAFLDACGYPGP